MNTRSGGPITPCSVVEDSAYWREIETRRPRPRLRPEDRWIKELQERGSVGALFELQRVDAEIQRLELLQRHIHKSGARTAVPICTCGKHKPQEKKDKKEKRNKADKKEKIKEKAKEETENDTEQSEEQDKEAAIEKECKPDPKPRYLRAHQISGPPLDVEEYPPIDKIDLTNPDKVRVSVATSKAAASVQFQHRNINYIRANAYALKSDRYQSNRCDTAKSVQDLRSYKPGEVPNYLKAMKKKAEEKRQVSESTQISTERLLTSLERRLILESLNKDLEEAFQELNKLPISMETLRSRVRKDQIEKQIEEINKRIGIFSKSNIYVAE